MLTKPKQSGIICEHKFFAGCQNPDFWTKNK